MRVLWGFVGFYKVLVCFNMFQQCFKPTTLRFATYVHQFSSAKLWSHVEGSFLETMRVCTSWWSKFDS